MSDSAPEIEDAQAQQILAEAVQPAETAPQTQQAGEATAEPEPEQTDTGFDAAAWQARFGAEDPAKVQKQLAHAREWEKRAKANSKAAEQLKEIEDAQKTEQERLTEAKEAADREVAELRAANARLKAATTHGLPHDLLDFLGGGSEEEITERARLLAERLKAAAPPPPPPPAEEDPRPTPQRPVESLTPGARPASEVPADPNDAFRAFLTGRRS